MSNLSLALNFDGGELSKRRPCKTDKRTAELEIEVKEALRQQGKLKEYLELSSLEYEYNSQELERYYEQGYKDALKNILTLGLYNRYRKRKYMY